MSWPKVGDAGDRRRDDRPDLNAKISTGPNYSSLNHFPSKLFLIPKKILRSDMGYFDDRKIFNRWYTKWDFFKVNIRERKLFFWVLDTLWKLFLVRGKFEDRIWGRKNFHRVLDGASIFFTRIFMGRNYSAMNNFVRFWIFYRNNFYSGESLKTVHGVLMDGKFPLDGTETGVLLRWIFMGRNYSVVNNFVHFWIFRRNNFYSKENLKTVYGILMVIKISTDVQTGIFSRWIFMRRSYFMGSNFFQFRIFYENYSYF